MSLSYADRCETHTFDCQFEHGSVHGNWDRMQLALQLSDGNREDYDFSKSWDRNQVFMKQTQSLINDITGIKPWEGATLKEGMDSLGLILKMKNGMKSDG